MKVTFWSTALKWNHGFLRGYPEYMIDEEMKKVKFSEKGWNSSKGSKGVPFVVTYQPSLICLNHIIKDNLNTLYMSREAKAVFSPGPMVSFKSARRISSYLVRAFRKMCRLKAM